MKTDKEYPATHSMSTSWYIVDDEGNVGLMDYNENGPEPWGMEQTSCDELVFGHWEYEAESSELLRFNLTNEQILDLLHEPHKPSEENYWDDCVVKIDKAKTGRFLQLCGSKDVLRGDVWMVSEELSLYYIDIWFRCTTDTKDGKRRPKGSLKKMIDEGIIVEVYGRQSVDMNDELKDGKIVHTKEFDNCPYFVFHQPYSSGVLPQKMHQPKHPVKIEQVPESFRCRIHKIPGKFRNMETFQIAQFYPCSAFSVEGEGFYMNGCLYQSFPLPDGSSIYAKMEIDNGDFPPCSAFNGCSNSLCFYKHRLFFDCTLPLPTVLIVHDPDERFNCQLETSRMEVERKMFAVPCLPLFPCDERKDDLQKSSGWLETIVADMKPRVILATDKALETISAFCGIAIHEITIGGEQYPFYRYAERDEHWDEIEKLAGQPFRGRLHPQTITSREMAALVKKGLAR